MKTKLSPPWNTYYKNLVALFGQDEEIKLRLSQDPLEAQIIVSNMDKANALARLLPKTVTFGNVVMRVSVIPVNEKNLIEVAFEGNPVVKEIHSGRGEFTYVVFKNEVVQYYNDELEDVNGFRSTLYQDIAKEVFDNTGVFFCTELGEANAKHN